MSPLSLLPLFFKWYLYNAPQGIIRLALNLSGYVEDMFGLRLTLKNYFTPMWHDTTWAGRGISLGVRTAWLFGGGLVWLLISAFAFLALPLWFFAHLLIFFDPYIWFAWLATIGLLFLLRVTIYDEAWNPLPQEFDPETTLLAMPGYLRSAVNQYPDLSRIQASLALWWQRLNLYPLPIETKNPTNSKPDLLKQLWTLASSQSSAEIKPQHLIQALFQIDPRFQSILKTNQVKSPHLDQLLNWMNNLDLWQSNYPLWSTHYTIPKLAGVNRALTGVVTPILDSFSVDLTEAVAHLPEAVDRNQAYHQLLQTLARPNRHALIVGEPGCGKTTFVGGLAQMIMRGNAPQEIAMKRLVKLEPGMIIAGAKTQGELSARMLNLLGEIKFSEDVLLFIDEIHTLLTAEETSEGLNLYSVMEPLLTEPAIRIIGATTLGNYRQFIEPNAAFSKMFDLIKLDAVDLPDLYTIIENIALEIESRHAVVITVQAIEAAITLSERYVHDRVLPDKAIDLLEKAATLVKEQVTHLNSSTNNRVILSEASSSPLSITAKSNGPSQSSLSPQLPQLVLPEHIAQVVSRTVGVPVTQIGQEERQKLLKLEKLIHQAYVDQKQAVYLVSDALRRARLDIRETTRPIGSFLFVGPTGVGKTELARRLSAIYFGTDNAIIRFDMSEYAHPDMVSRLIGSSPGSSKFPQPGQLTERIRRQPFALVLLDEIEKAHSSVWDLFLQVMDEGRLTDSSGHTIDFRNTILIFTSNAVTQYITQELEAGRKLEVINKQLFNQLQKTFRTEFLNRFDGIIPFRPLNQDEMVTIAQLQLNNLAQRLKTKNITIKYSPELVNRLAQLGTSKTLGARPLKRLIQDKLESHLAKALLESPPDQPTTITLKPSLLN
jgi:ATP-dependent Clp protease ATP-binding subunit ClpC